MTAAAAGLLSGTVLATLSGYQLFKAARTGSIWVRKMEKGKAGWRLRYWQMHRSENPRAFWMNIALMTLFFVFGIFLAGWAIISPNTIH